MTTEHILCSACATAPAIEPLFPTRVVYLLERLDPEPNELSAQTRFEWRARRGVDLPSEARVALLQTVFDQAGQEMFEKELPALGLLMRSHLLMGALFLFEYRTTHYLDLTSAVRARLSKLPPSAGLGT